MAPSPIELLASVTFALALIHTFSVKQMSHIARKYPKGSIGENLFHALGEVEVVFGLWAALFIAGFALLSGKEAAIAHIEGLNFTEPAFVFAVMTIAATRPILNAGNALISLFSKILPLPKNMAYYVSVLAIGPLLGSFITEPAAMTVTALILKSHFYDKRLSKKLMYATIGVLFVNVSIGGTLTPFAAPPVLMVASQWNWNLAHMFLEFGIRAIPAVFLSTLFTAFLFRRELAALPTAEKKVVAHTPLWLTALHILFLSAIVIFSHHTVIFLGLFLFFLGVASVTEEHQDPLQIRGALLVGFFLGGLVVLGSGQVWWLNSLLHHLSAGALYAGSIALTALVDNAALTYLGSQVPNLSEISKYALVAGAVSGGGLTVIANAPNPAGYSILNHAFGEEGISPLLLFLGALGPTAIAIFFFWVL